MKDPSHFVRLNAEARSDIKRLYRFANKWNGVAMMYQASQQKCDACIVSDALGKWGCRAFFGMQRFNLRWPTHMQETHITVKELVHIVLGAALWGKDWTA